jgi:hypothetical protein
VAKVFRDRSVEYVVEVAADEADAGRRDIDDPCMRRVELDVVRNTEARRNVDDRRQP